MLANTCFAGARVSDGAPDSQQECIAATQIDSARPTSKDRGKQPATKRQDRGGGRRDAMTTTTAGAAAAEAATLAERLRLPRTQALPAQEQLAERARLSVRPVRNLEAGRVRRPRAGPLRLLLRPSPPAHSVVWQAA
jgi:hypothetical protein